MWVRPPPREPKGKQRRPTSIFHTTTTAARPRMAPIGGPGPGLRQVLYTPSEPGPVETSTSAVPQEWRGALRTSLPARSAVPMYPVPPALPRLWSPCPSPCYATTSVSRLSCVPEKRGYSIHSSASALALSLSLFSPLSPPPLSHLLILLITYPASLPSGQLVPSTAAFSPSLSLSPSVPLPLGQSKRESI